MPDPLNPAIVVAAFNRPGSLRRVLKSLSSAVFHGDVTLVVSIDNNGENEDVVKVAEEFDWPYGTKEVHYQPERLGLRKHILKCGDLSLTYGSVIVLEDDVFASPYFYLYATKATTFYHEDERIAGISLYNQPYTESVKLPFIPLKGSSDVYFMQVASSYGQLWTSKQWSAFKEWYENAPVIEEIVGLPNLIKLWPETSWKKFYCAYLVDREKYFVFPQLSYTTSFSDPGTNFVYRNHFGQTQIDIANHDPAFEPLEESLSVYDAYSEIRPDCLKRLAKDLEPYDIEVDLYGKKEGFTREYVLTSKLCRNPVLSFERSMKPHELNIIFDIQGNDIFLVRSADVLFFPNSLDELLFNRNITEYIREFSYYHVNVFSTDILLRILKSRIGDRMKRFFRGGNK